MASEDTDLRPAKEHPIPEKLLSSTPDENWPVEWLEVGGGSSLKLKKRVPPEQKAVPLLSAETADAAGASVSDLLPNKYEGGFKVWECARDLLEVMDEMVTRGELQIENTAVLEAGCGAALPGVLALRLGARLAVLQDFNAAVLESVTMQTLQLNGLWHRARAGGVRLLSGDWASVDALLCDERRRRAPADNSGDSDGGFDLVLSADTIYCTAASTRLWQLVRSQLKRPNGVALIAAKSYYFGVGGSTAAFKALVDADGRFACESLRTFDDGASNRREVFAVRWRSDATSMVQAPTTTDEPAAKRAKGGGGFSFNFG